MGWWGGLSLMGWRANRLRCGGANAKVELPQRLPSACAQQLRAKSKGWMAVGGWSCFSRAEVPNHR